MKWGKNKAARAKTTASRELLMRAASMTLLFLVCQVAGFREYTSFLCGMPGADGVFSRATVFFGVAYVVTYLCVVILVPIFVVAALIIFAADRHFFRGPRISVA